MTGNSRGVRRTMRMAGLAATLALAATLVTPLAAQQGSNRGQDGRNGNKSVAARLGGEPGILGFLEQLAVPALLSDPEIAAFFTNLTESPNDIEECLARLLDHDLGGSSPHFGAVLADGHQCRSSMSNIHRGLNIPDRIIDKFIGIVGQQAAMAGVADSDIAAVAKELDKYRGGVRNK